MSKRLALLVGCTHYQDPRLALLPETTANLHTLAAMLRDPAIGNFEAVKTLIDSSVQEICRQVTDLLYRRKRHDVILLYFTGHGLVDEAGQLYLATAATEVGSLAETAMPADFLTGQMDRSFSRQQILLLDCPICGLGPDGMRPEVGVSAETGAAFRGSGWGRTVLTATDLIDYSLAGPELLGNAPESRFTHFLMQGLRSGAADADGDGQVGLRELYDYIHGQMVRHRSPHRPRHWSYEEQDRFIMARNPRLFKPARLKWDLIFGAIMAPTATVAIGGQADFGTSIGLAGLLMLLYAGLYLVLE